MENREQLEGLIRKYFEEILPKYKEVTVAAANAGKKLPVFHKTDFSGHIENFRQMKSAAQELLPVAEKIDIPALAQEERTVARALVASLRDFILLCERNMSHYDLMDRRQYRKNHVSMEDFRLSVTGVNAAMMKSVESLNALETADRVLHGETVRQDPDSEHETDGDTASDDEQAQDCGQNREGAANEQNGE
ncbi:MAG: hypothetical protein SOR91_09495 [Hornefia butyriciproducens]|uniref:hypothetical protein n=1 Tax=Hornefia butyriciproducens TaxID=2652293 RepID=UPI002A74917D|nr:hypothetical protein [Hornefia butyriciproducens]MCI7327332.1 hypothetical protein [Clostridiales bacterium]MDY2991688.1 hypothetical protein [Hornefia butyriciproducens]